MLSAFLQTSIFHISFLLKEKQFRSGDAVTSISFLWLVMALPRGSYSREIRSKNKWLYENPVKGIKWSCMLLLIDSWILLMLQKQLQRKPTFYTHFLSARNTEYKNFVTVFPYHADRSCRWTTFERKTAQKDPFIRSSIPALYSHKIKSQPYPVLTMGPFLESPETFSGPKSHF